MFHLPFLNQIRSIVNNRKMATILVLFYGILNTQNYKESILFWKPIMNRFRNSSIDLIFGLNRWSINRYSFRIYLVILIMWVTFYLPNYQMNLLSNNYDNKSTLCVSLLNLNQMIILLNGSTNTGYEYIND